MTFHFKLETLLNYRSLLEEQAQQALAREQAAWEKIQLLLARHQAERLNISAEFENRKKENMPALRFSFYMDLLDFKEQEIRDRQQMLVVQKKKVEKARLVLLDKVKERKVMEKAREKEYQLFLQESLRVEDKEADELAVLRHGRKGGLFY